MQWLRSLLPRGPDRRWRASLVRSRTTHVHDPNMPVRTPPPTPRDLVDVLGVARTEVVDGRALTLLALERYREADVVTFRFARRRLGLDHPSPELRVAIEPESLGARVWVMGGGGGGVGLELVWRMSYAIAPPTPRDSTFAIVVSAIDWRRHEPGDVRAFEDRPVDVEPGPWRFEITPS